MNETKRQPLSEKYEHVPKGVQTTVNLVCAVSIDVGLLTEPATIFREHLHLPPKARCGQRNIRTRPCFLEACLDKCGVVILALRFERLHQTKQGPAVFAIAF